MEALVKSELLVWARQSAGLSIEDAASKVDVAPEKLASWERGDQLPTVSQLRKLGTIYKRPIAVFYLPEPPVTFKVMHDFRRLYDQAARAESPELRFEIRRAHQRRAVALDLYDEIEETSPTLDLQIAATNDPEVVAGHIRNLLGVSFDQQVKWKQGSVALKRWREAIGALGILVFQATGIAVSEMRGFSINERPLPVIVMNGRDSARGRIFTMIHELAHVLLGEDAICTLHETGLRNVYEQNIEVFCNKIAAATLVPREYLQIEDLVSNRPLRTEWSDQDLDTLASRYQVSREVILRRLLTLGRTTEAFYKQKREEFQKEYEELERKQKHGFASPSQKVLSSAGATYIRLVLNSYHQENITASDLSSFLGVRLKHVAKIEQAVAE